MDQLAALTGRYKLPPMYSGREFAEAGGLVSYGPDFADGYRHAGLYAAKILKGHETSRFACDAVDQISARYQSQDR